jgi:hypothetical protein
MLSRIFRRSRDEVTWEQVTWEEVTWEEVNIHNEVFNYMHCSPSFSGDMKEMNEMSRSHSV